MIIVLVDQFAKMISVKAFVPIFILKVAFKIFSSTFICFFKKYANESLLFNVQRGSNIEVVLSV